LRSELAQALAEKGRRKSRDRLSVYAPYRKQIDFHAAGASCRERLLMAGNQLGKTYCGAAEAAIHLTGLYPEWWRGRRFERPVRAWVGSKTGEVTRDGAQRLLVGEPRDKGQWGTGMIPGARLIGCTARSSTPGALDGLTVRHVSGGISTLGFKSYAARALNGPA
jgi:hypothetical protein